ncbi:putative small protein [Latilactobacillus sakei subsp. sakei LS25]|nr:putative small protein [Latilactobacillus sakei subsp. sakei LS25]
MCLKSMMPHPFFSILAVSVIKGNKKGLAIANPFSMLVH